MASDDVQYHRRSLVRRQGTLPVPLEIFRVHAMLFAMEM